MRALGGVRRRGVSVIPFTLVRCIADTIQVDVDGDELEAGHLESWLAEHVVRHIPGSGSDDSEGSERK
jgi:hypothetical protein